MYLFLIILASQIALHRWIVITNDKKMALQQLMQRIQTTPQDLVGKKIEENPHSLRIITHKDQQYEIAQKHNQTDYIINPKPNNFEIGKFLPLFWRYAPEGYGSLSSENKVQLEPSSITLRRMNVHFIAGKVETLNTIRNGPNKNSLVLHYTHYRYHPHCLLRDTSSTMLISTIKQIYDWFVDPCFVRIGENEPFIYASALAPKSNRYVFISSTDYSYQEHSLVLYDFIEKYKSARIAKLSLAFEAGSTFYDLCFASGTILFCLINSCLYKFNLEKNGTITQIPILDKDSQRQPLQLISFSADPKFLSLGFMLKPKNERGAYAICACNLATGTYKK